MASKKPAPKRVVKDVEKEIVTIEKHLGPGGIAAIGAALLAAGYAGWLLHGWF